MMKTLLVLAALASIVACIPVTVNLNFNFPQKEMEEKLFEMERKVQEDGLKEPGPPTPGGDAAAFDPVPAPQDPRIDINVKTPAIDRINEGRKKRVAALQEHAKVGRIGETLTGTVGNRDDAGLEGKAKADFLRLVKDENGDRERLFEEILKANKLGDEQLDNVRKAFAKARYRSLEVGHYLQNKKGEWRKKTDEDRKKLDKGEEIE